MQAVVPAAGEGSRLRPLTADRPKALVEIGGRPLLAHGLEALLDCGVDGAVVVVGADAGAIRERFGHAFEGLPVTYVRQRRPRGVADAVLAAAPALDGDFCVLNGDNVHRSNLAAAVEAHARSPAAATLLVESVDEAEARETGVLSFADGRVDGLVEKPAEPPSTVVSAGFLAASPALLDACRLVTPSERGEYELTSALDLLCRAGHDVRTVELEGWRVNVNTPEDVATAAARLDGVNRRGGRRSRR